MVNEKRAVNFVQAAMKGKLVMPGDKLGVEEEFVSSENTFVDDEGAIRAAIIGNTVVQEGRISVVNANRDINKFKRGMWVIGQVTDDLRSVMFIKIDRIRTDGKEYIAIKDGKIVNAPKRPMGRGGGRDFGGQSREEQSTKKEGKEAGVGDVILAKILYEDPEIFTLTLNDKESGVVYTECELCGAEMRAENGGTLACGACGHRESRKVSPLYNNPEAIKKLFA